MIDFAGAIEHEAPLRHDVPWELGNHEDGYLVGLANLRRLWGSLLEADEWSRCSTGLE